MLDVIGAENDINKKTVKNLSIDSIGDPDSLPLPKLEHEASQSPLNAVTHKWDKDQDQTPMTDFTQRLFTYDYDESDDIKWKSLLFAVNDDDYEDKMLFTSHSMDISIFKSEVDELSSKQEDESGFLWPGSMSKPMSVLGLKSFIDDDDANDLSLTELVMPVKQGRNKVQASVVSNDCTNEPQKGTKGKLGKGSAKKTIMV